MSSNDCDNVDEIDNGKEVEEVDKPMRSRRMMMRKRMMRRRWSLMSQQGGLQ